MLENYEAAAAAALDISNALLLLRDGNTFGSSQAPGRFIRLARRGTRVAFRAATEAGGRRVKYGSDNGL